MVEANDGTGEFTPCIEHKSIINNVAEGVVSPDSRISDETLERIREWLMDAISHTPQEEFPTNLPNP